LRVALLSREYPPEVYGGAGVHVEHLSAELARLVELEVHCFGGERPSPDDLDGTISALGTFTAGTGSFTLVRGHDTFTIEVSPSTTYSAQAGGTVSWSSLAVNEHLHVHGTATAVASVVAATSVRIERR
jgi:hypothetical protein